MKTGAMENRTTTTITNFVQRSNFTTGGTGTTGTVRPTMTGSARYAKVTAAGLIADFTQAQMIQCLSLHCCSCSPHVVLVIPGVTPKPEPATAVPGVYQKKSIFHVCENSSAVVSPVNSVSVGHLRAVLFPLQCTTPQKMAGSYTTKHSISSTPTFSPWKMLEPSAKRTLVNLQSSQGRVRGSSSGDRQETLSTFYLRQQKMVCMSTKT